ncbi:MAG: hypothetical protein K9M07_03225 [Simkaniaceae bacterium]|nr:hypothetical protein [Simkaniaceae bacterium]
MQKKKDDSNELFQFVDRIANLFQTRNLFSAELIITRQAESETHCQLSGYQLKRDPFHHISHKAEATEKERSYTKMTPERGQGKDRVTLMQSQVNETHRLTIKQDLHFDAFKKLLLEKGLVLKRVIDWKLQQTDFEIKKIKEYGKHISAVEVNPHFSRTVCVITKKPTSQS